MADTLSETKACDLLARLFTARGYRIVRNVLFREYGVEFHADGWDAKARVGFEFLSSEDEDHIDLSLEEYQTLSDAQRRGELALFIIDEVEPLSAADLVAEAADFLDEVAAAVRARAASKAGKGRRPAPGGKPRGAAKAVARKSVPAVRTIVANKPVVKRAKKPAGTKAKAAPKAGTRGQSSGATGKKVATGRKPAGGAKPASPRKPGPKTRSGRATTGAAARPAASTSAGGARTRRR